jgi:two-component system CheB/CheR fusion protein
MEKKKSSKPESKAKSGRKKDSPGFGGSDGSDGAVDDGGGGSRKDFLVVGLGASAGGVTALQEFFATMPPNSGMAFVVILHLSPQHESNLKEVIQARTTMPVSVVTGSEKVEPNRVYVIPPNRRLEMVDGLVRCTEPSGERAASAAIDVFFRTLAEAYRENAVCIVLSGMGTDGTLGLKAVKGANGFAIVQQPENAQHDSMPRSAISTGVVDWILPVGRMPERLIEFRDSSERLHLTTDDGDGKVAAEIQADNSLGEILTILRARTGHDFSNYRTPTLIRRIARHLQIHDLEDIPAYLEFLRGQPDEIHLLLKNLLINVTSFFRDPEAWAVLEREVVPQLFNRKKGDTIRVWSCGCASGEEAYSLAIVLSEYAEKLPSPPKIQIFATDVDEDAIAEAREHRYPLSIEADISPERLKRYFIKEGKYYRVKKDLREMVLFAPHNLLRDPPFSRLDLIACRNLLIYLNRETQARVMEIFHFALAPHGYLFLGSSETAEIPAMLFAPLDKKLRVYSRNPAHVAQPVIPPRMPEAGRWNAKLPEIRLRMREQSYSLGELHYRLLESFAPPSILVNQDFEVQYTTETAGRFLRVKGGEPSSSLLKLIHADLLPDLRAALFTSQRDKRTSTFENVRVNLETGARLVDLVVRPVEIDGVMTDYLLVIINENKKALPQDGDGAPESVVHLLDKDDAMQTVVVRLEEELGRAKLLLRATNEQHEVAVEELKASNEELQAINEELLSTTEELETSREELQSVNEELTAVNHEHREKIEETTRANADLLNLMASTEIATIFLDGHLRIKRLTPPVEKIFSFTQTDIGRPVEHFTSNLDYPDLETDAQRVLKSLQPVEREIRSRDRKTYLTRVLPYRTLDDRIDGVVLNFVDITRLKRAEEARFFLAAIVESSEDSIITIDFDGIITTWNKSAERVYGYSAREAVGKPLSLLALPPDLKHVFASADRIKRGEQVSIYDTVRVHKDGHEISLEVTMSPVRNEAGEVIGVSTIARDIAARKADASALRASEERFRVVVDSASDYAIFTLDENNKIQSWNRGAENVFGWTEEEAIGMDGALLFIPEDRLKGEHLKEIKTALREGRAEDERWHLRKDQTLFFASGMLMRLEDGTSGFVKICRDQTERVKSDTVRREKDMLAQLVTTQEDERRRIARDIHDHVGQQLTVLRLKLEEAKKACGDNSPACTALDEIDEIAGRLDKEVDFLAWELRPAALDDLGLALSVENFAREFSHHTGIRTEFHAVGMKRMRFAFEIETNLYRIAQEALNNVFKHAKGKHVSVLLEKRDGAISLIIEDDGVGFNPKNRRNRTRGVGLIGMSERAKICGGKLEIESARGKGTTIFVRVPATKA